MADKTYTVTVATGNRYPSGSGTGSVYYLDGVRDLDITWIQGATLRFNQDDSSNDNHPLLFTNDSSNPNSGRIETGVVYNLDGSTVPYSDYASGAFNSATTRYGEITPASSQDLFYYCYYHGIAMGGELDIISNAWSALSWGEGQWNDQGSTAISPTGIGTTISLGSTTIDANVELGWGREAWGQQVWGDNENLVSVDLTGIGLTANLGSVTINSEINIGWGRKAWGDLSWSVSFANETAEPTGIGMTVTLGDERIAGEINTGWGREAWGQQVWGDNENFTDVSVTGQQLTIPTGSVTINSEINLGWGRKAWGDLDWGGISDSIQVAPTGIGMTVALGTAVGTPNTIASPSGIALTSTVGSVSLTGTGTVTLTGNNLTTSTGSLNALIWETVDTGTTATWREVDTAA